MDIIIGILLSTLISALTPIIEKYSSLPTKDAKKLLIAVIAILVALLLYFAGDNFKNSLGTILASSVIYYEYIYRLIIGQIAGEKPIELYFTEILNQKKEQ
jgi:hypothetical protein